MYEFKKNGKVFTSISVGNGPSFYEKRIYLAAVSQRLRITALRADCHHRRFCQLFSLSGTEPHREERAWCELCTESFGAAFILSQSSAFEYTNFLPRSVGIIPNKFPCFRYVFARESLGKHLLEYVRVNCCSRHTAENSVCLVGVYYWCW